MEEQSPKLETPKSAVPSGAVASESKNAVAELVLCLFGLAFEVPIFIGEMTWWLKGFAFLISALVWAAATRLYFINFKRSKPVTCFIIILLVFNALVGVNTVRVQWRREHPTPELEKPSPAVTEHPFDSSPKDTANKFINPIPEYKYALGVDHGPTPTESSSPNNGTFDEATGLKELGSITTQSTIQKLTEQEKQKEDAITAWGVHSPVFDHITKTFLDDLRTVASKHGDEMVSDYKGMPDQVPFPLPYGRLPIASAFLKSNTPWAFAIELGDDLGNSNMLRIWRHNNDTDVFTAIATFSIKDQNGGGGITMSLSTRGGVQDINIYGDSSKYDINQILQLLIAAVINKEGIK